jgi:hypothetical protein
METCGTPVGGRQLSVGVVATEGIETANNLWGACREGTGRSWGEAKKWGI